MKENKVGCLSFPSNLIYNHIKVHQPCFLQLYLNWLDCCKSAEVKPISIIWNSFFKITTNYFYPLLLSYRNFSLRRRLCGVVNWESNFASHTSVKEKSDRSVSGVLFIRFVKTTSLIRHFDKLVSKIWRHFGKISSGNKHKKGNLCGRKLPYADKALSSKFLGFDDKILCEEKGLKSLVINHSRKLRFKISLLSNFLHRVRKEEKS